ncbi:MAG TPA: hypothetical protein VMI72_14595 [Roseiarcus sp.]|nr:hypothetical protein [Roseiarcus sp.]
MNSLGVAVSVGLLIAGSGFLGLLLQRWLAEHHTMERSRDMIGGVVGLLTLLLALVLGLLIWTSYGVYNTQQTELQTIAARALEFDLEMRQYGAEADRGRELLRRDLVWAHEQFWGDDESRSMAYDASYKAMGDLNVFFDSLEPKTPAQTSLLQAARANYAFIGEQRILMSMQAATPVAWPLVYAVTFWSCLMFAGMGLLSKLKPMAVAMDTLGAVSIAIAIFLILEFNKPYTGSIRVPPVPLEQAIVVLDQPGPGEAGASQ